MDRFQAITAFARVVELGSFARAAERLSVSTSAVSRQVAELEAHLDARLLNRTTRRLSLTEAGQAFYERSVQLLADLDDAESVVRTATVVPKGRLRLTCGITFGVRYLAPAIAEFGARHPQLTFDLDLSDRTTDLVEEGFDLAVRIGTAGPARAGCAPSRAHATDLLRLAVVSRGARRTATSATTSCDTSASSTRICRPQAHGHSRTTMDVVIRSVCRARVRANNGRMLTALAVAGLGIVLEPDFIVAPEIRAGRLRPLLPQFAPPRTPIAAVYPSRRHLSPKVRAFVNFLADRFSSGPPWTI